MYIIVKRTFDTIFSLCAFIVLAPVFLMIIFILYSTGEKMPFFFQERPGKNGKLFRLIKFRTMDGTRDENGNLLADSERLTWFGRFLRSTSLDELPQLINVLRGEMSIIGPRPLRVEYLGLYTKKQMRRHDVKPGITGWAQINGRNAVSWDKRFDYDLYYVDHISIGLDMKIFFLTFLRMVQRKGINSPTSATMEPFNGSN